MRQYQLIKQNKKGDKLSQETFKFNQMLLLTKGTQIPLHLENNFSKSEYQ